MKRKCFALLIMLVMVGTLLPLHVFATGSASTSGGGDDLIPVTADIEPIMFQIETAAPSLWGVFDNPATLSDGNHEKWIDRIDLDGDDDGEVDEDAQWVVNFYNQLVEASDNDGEDDFLIEDSYYASPTNLRVVHTVSGQHPNGEGTGPEGAFVEGDFDTVNAELPGKYAPYLIAACSAFDRDHPEVFWLNGSCSVGAGVTEYSPTTGKYTAEICFFLSYESSEDSFSVRSSNYDEEAIKDNITTRNNAVAAILTKLAEQGHTTHYEKIAFFNEWLTKNNEYNALVADNDGGTNPADNDPWECISALDGRVGDVGPVCEAYSRAFKVLCDHVGIACVLESGDAGGAHMWNSVKLGNKWYAVDVTWNDPGYGTGKAESGNESEEYLAVGSDPFSNNHEVTNQVTQNGLRFTNGPELETGAYVPYTTTITADTATDGNGDAVITYGENIQFLVSSVATAAEDTQYPKPEVYYNDTELTSGVTISDTPNGQNKYTVTIDAAAAGFSAGEYVLEVRFPGSNEYPDATPVTVNFAIGKADVVYTAPTAKSGLVYNGEEQALIDAGTVTTPDLKMEYSTDGNNWSTAIPTGENVGNYTVHYRVAGGNNYNDVTSTIGPITISKGASEVTTQPATATDLTYNGQNQNLLTNGGAVSLGTPEYSTDGNSWSTALPTGKNAGTYKVYFCVPGTDNYDGIPETSLGTVTIKKAVPTISQAPVLVTGPLTFNANNRSLLAQPGSVNGGECTIEYRVGEDGTWSSTATACNAGTYTVYYRIVGNDNYESDLTPVPVGTVTIIPCDDAVVNLCYTIDATNDPRTITVIATVSGLNQTAIKDGTVTFNLTGGTATPTGSVENVPIANGQATATYTAASGQKLTFTAAFSGSSNYNAKTSSPYEVNTDLLPQDDLIVESATVMKYGETLTLQVAGGSGDGAITYAITDGAGNATLIGDRLTATGVGAVTVRATKAASGNYAEASKDILITINKADPTVTPPTVRKGLIYRGPEQALVTAGSVPSGHGTMEYRVGTSGEWKTTVPKEANAGSYKVFYQVLGNDNYNGVSPTSIGTVTIGKATSNYTPPTARSGLVCNGTPQELINPGTVTSGHGTMQYRVGTSGEWKTEIPKATDAGRYTVHYQIPETANYKGIQNCSISVTIAAVPEIEYTSPRAKSLTYSGAAQALVTAGSVTSGQGTMQYQLGTSGEWGTDVPTATNAGTYTVYYKVVGANGYEDVDAQSITVTINKARAAVTKTPTGKSLYYNGSTQTLITAGTAEGGTMMYGMSSDGSKENNTWSTYLPTAKNEGVYRIFYKVFGDENHYDTASKYFLAWINDDPNANSNTDTSGNTSTSGNNSTSGDKNTSGSDSNSDTKKPKPTPTPTPDLSSQTTEPELIKKPSETVNTPSPIQMAKPAAEPDVTIEEADWTAVSDKLKEEAKKAEERAKEAANNASSDNEDDGITAVLVKATSDSKLPDTVFSSIAGKPMTVTFDLGAGFYWSVNGEEIPAASDTVYQGYDLGVASNTGSIPAAVSETLPDGVTGNPPIDLSLSHEGAFGFRMTLTVPVGTERSGYWANLYYFNPAAQKMEFRCAVKIDQLGNAHFPFTHASQYAVVIDASAHSAETINAANPPAPEEEPPVKKPENNKPVSTSRKLGVGVIISLVVAVLAVAGAILVLVTKLRRHNEEERKPIFHEHEHDNADTAAEIAPIEVETELPEIAVDETATDEVDAAEAGEAEVVETIEMDAVETGEME